MPRLFRVILPITNIEMANNFYSLALGTPRERVSPGRHYFECGGTVFASNDPAADGDGLQESWRHHPQQYVYFEVSNLGATLQQAMDAGCQIVEGEIQKMPWGEHMFWAKYPFDNPISFVDEATLFTGHRK